MTGQEIFQLVGSILGTGVVATIVGALINRRKLSAETIEVIDRAASSAVKRSEEDNTRLRAEADASRRREQEAQEREERLWRKARELEHENAVLIDVVRDHIGHSRRCTAEIRRLGGTVEDPPDLPSELLGLHPSGSGESEPAR